MGARVSLNKEEVKKMDNLAKAGGPEDEGPSYPDPHGPEGDGSQPGD